MRPARWRGAHRVGAEELRDYARVLVRAGYLDRGTAEAEVAAAAGQDHGVENPEAEARTLVAWAVGELRADQVEWPATTDHDRLARAFEILRSRGVLVLEHVEDHWAATKELESRDDQGERVPGVVWFTPPDVWHAVQHRMLELNLWHGDTANAAPGDALLDEVLDVLHRQGLAAHFDEGRIEVTCSWQRRSRY